MERLILVVDDDEDILETTARALRSAGHRVLVAQRGADAMQLARETHPDLVVLDIIMPGMNGIEVCRHIRANPELARTPILFLTSKGTIGDKVDGFESGADDYITKPFDLRELALRVKALLRRAQFSIEPTEVESIELGHLVLNCRTFEVSTPQRTTLLTPVEYELLRFLMTNTGRVYSADQLLQQVWGYPPGVGMPDLVRVHIKNVRAKIEPDPRHPIYLRNVLRRGYMIEAPKQ